MERLIKPAIDGGVPYINQDFFNVLQQSNLLSYKSFVETINDTKEIGNSGIIIKGVVNKSLPNQQVCNFDFTNSMVYLDGDFLEPEPSLSLQDNKQIDALKFYLVRVSDEEVREKKVSGFLEPVLIKSYFDIITDTPPSGQSYIEIEIKNNRNICSRYLDRLLRYNLTQYGQVQMTFLKDSFDQNGKGFGDMFGFHICNGKSGTQDLDSRYLIGYATQSNSTLSELPQSDSDKTNYKKIGNKGGSNLITLLDKNLPTHDHGGLTDEANNDMRHSHEIQYGNWQSTQPTVVGKAFARTKKINTTDPSIPNAPFTPGGIQNNFKSFFTLAEDAFYEVKNTPAVRNAQTGLWEHGFTGHVSGDTLIEVTPKLGDHTHPIDPNVAGSSSHPNEPPYTFVIYYEKINPYI